MSNFGTTENNTISLKDEYFKNHNKDNLSRGRCEKEKATIDERLEKGENKCDRNDKNERTSKFFRVRNYSRVDSQN
jgi:hypothetical protein